LPVVAITCPFLTLSPLNQLDDYLLKSISAPLKALIWFAWFYLSINALKGEVALLHQ
jgi:MscS family membrane protein